MKPFIFGFSIAFTAIAAVIAWLIHTLFDDVDIAVEDEAW